MDNCTKIECNHCSSKVIPRLIMHREENIIYERINGHVCLICESTMYKSGGELTKIGSVILKLLPYVIFVLIIFNIESLLRNKVLLFIACGFMSGLFFSNKKIKVSKN